MEVDSGEQQVFGLSSTERQGEIASCLHAIPTVETTQSIKCNEKNAQNSEKVARGLLRETSVTTAEQARHSRFDLRESDRAVVSSARTTGILNGISN